MFKRLLLSFQMLRNILKTENHQLLREFLRHSSYQFRQLRNIQGIDSKIVCLDNYWLFRRCFENCWQEAVLVSFHLFSIKCANNGSNNLFIISTLKFKWSCIYIFELQMLFFRARPTTRISRSTLWTLPFKNTYIFNNLLWSSSEWMLPNQSGLSEKKTDSVQTNRQRVRFVAMRESKAWLSQLETKREKRSLNGIIVFFYSRCQISWNSLEWHLRNEWMRCREREVCYTFKYKTYEIRRKFSG